MTFVVLFFCALVFCAIWKLLFPIGFVSGWVGGTFCFVFLDALEKGVLK